MIYDTPNCDASWSVTTTWGYQNGDTHALVMGPKARPPSSSGVVAFYQAPALVALPAGFMTMDTYMARREADPARAKRMERARIRMADRIAEPGKPMTLQQLRLRAGLSQAQLAKMIDTSQPRLSLLEQGKQEPGLQVIERLRISLMCTRDELFEALLSNREPA